MNEKKMFLITVKDVLPIGAELQQIHIHEEGKVVDLYYQVYNQHWVAKSTPHARGSTPDSTAQ